MTIEATKAHRIIQFNQAIGELLKEKGQFKLADLAEKLGMNLIYSADKEDLRIMMNNNRREVDLLWAVKYQASEQYVQDYFDLKPKIEARFEYWKNEHHESYSTFRSLGFSDGEIILQLIEEVMFQSFLNNICKRHNLFLVFYKRGKYIEPSYQHFQETIWVSLKRSTQQQYKCLERLSNYGMALPNADNLTIYLKQSKRLVQALELRRPIGELPE